MKTNVERYLRVRDIVRVPHAQQASLLPVSRGTWLKWVSTGKAPRPIKLSPGVVLWRESDVCRFIEREAARGDDVADLVAEATGQP